MASLTHEDISERVTNAIITILEDAIRQTIEVDDELEDLNLDSLDVVEMIMELEQHFKIDYFDTDDLYSAETVQDLIDFFVDKIHY